mgnify:FL=1|tara:strand:+ start:1286 stop:2017 length:732 start_codon:yes stop_codon:yes gene_type:complete
MGWLGTSNNNLSTQMNTQGQTQFKAINNLLTLQENHVEDFFQYHGEAFFAALEKLIEDVTERVMSQMLIKLKFVTNSSGNMEIAPDALQDYMGITAENIQLDLQNLLASAVNSEVVMQRRMAKQQYLEAQGFTSPSVPQSQTLPQQGFQQQGFQPQGANPQGLNPSQIQGGNMSTNFNNTLNQQQMAMNNGSGYPIPPSGYDNMNNPYWIDPQTGQPTYTPPQSGLGLAQGLGKAVAWAKWLA